MIGVIQVGNYQSVCNALNKINCCSITSLDITILEKCDAIILPGVGEFETVMKSIAPLTSFLRSYKKPFLGICAGMQVLFEKSQESPNITGLGIISGDVEKFTQVRTPQIGWNKLQNTNGSLLKKEDYVYFVNSYYCVPKEDVTIATSNYWNNFCAAVRKNNFYGVQFHPEKSGEFGLTILKNFTKLTQMLVIPAIDLLDGKCVRLTNGDKNKCTTYSENPIEVIRNFKAQGATLIHVIDLNGAFEGQMKNLPIIKELAKEVEIQVGGGIRTKQQIEDLRSNGVNRVIVTTNLNELKKYGVIAALDFKENQLAINGWTQTQNVNLQKLLTGIVEVIVTDVSTDGTLTGPNLQLIKQIQKYDVKVTASGGVSSLEDLKKLKQLEVNSVIVGKALYENKFTLKEAINYVN